MKLYKFLLLVLLFFCSCEKEYYDYQNCYDVPDNKIISTYDLVNHEVSIELSITNGYVENTETKIVQMSDLGRDVYSYEINGYVIGEYLYPSDTNIFVTMIVNYDTIDKVWKVNSLKPVFWDMHVWNSNSKASIGVEEDNSKIVIYSNNMCNEYYGKETMCMKLTIKK
jgi:hypothetical protein